MKPSGNTIKLLIAALCCAFLSVSCIREDFPVDCAEQGREVTLQINIAGSPITKAATGSASTELEKDIKSLRIYAFYKGASAGHCYIPDVSSYKDANTGELNFYMDLTMFIIGEQVMDFYVIANEASLIGLSPVTSLSETTTESQLNGMGFTSLVGVHDAAAAEQVTFPNGMVNVAKQSYCLVMSDSHKPNDAPGHEGHSLVDAVYLVDSEGNIDRSESLASVSFDLHRPVAKLCVFAAKAPGAPEDLKLTVSAVRLLKEGTRRYNYLMPQTAATLKSMQYTYDNTVNLHLSEEPAAGSGSTGGSVDVMKVLASAKSTNEADYTCVLLHDYYPHENAYGASPATWNLPVYYNPTVGADGKKAWEIAPAGDQPASEAEYKGNILEIDYYFSDDVTTKKTGKVYLPPIERNHYYGVYCSMKSAGGVSIQFNVMEWDNVQANWELDYNYPDYVDLYPAAMRDVLDANGNPVYDENNKKKQEYDYPAAGPTLYRSDDASGDFKAKFRIWGPQGCQWSPILEVKNVEVDPDGDGKTEWTEANTADYSFEVYEWVNGEMKDASKIVTETESGETVIQKTTYTNSDNEYEIHVKALGDNVNAIIKLGISFIPAWDRDSHILLMINGVTNELAWPNSGDGKHAEWIEIKQVEVPTTGGDSGNTGTGNGTQTQNEE